MINVRVLNSPDLIENACELLYKVYIADAKWQFNSNNPSLLRVKVKNKRKLLVDKFVDKSIWFGAFDNGLLIGCARLCASDKNGKFEVEGYQSSKVIHKYLPKNAFEMGKVAIKKEYKGQKIAHLLYLKAFEYAKHYQKSVFGCLNNSAIKLLFKQIELPLKMENAFKYEEHDDKLVNFYCINYENGEFEKVMANLEKLLPSAYLNYPSVFEMLEVVSLLMPIPMYWHDVDGVLLGINKHCLDGMGTTREKVINKTPHDFYPKEVAEYILSHNQKVMDTGETLFQEEVINNITTGKIVYAKAVKSPLYDEFGNVIGILGVSIDITAEKENEELQAQLSEQEIFKYCMDGIEQFLQVAKINVVNKRAGIKSALGVDKTSLVRLTFREGQILYLLSLRKSIKKIADIFSRMDNKEVTASTVNGMINKGLYPKFGVNSVEHLLEKATMLNMIPFLHDSFIGLAD